MPLNSQPGEELPLDGVTVVVFFADVLPTGRSPGSYRQVHQGQSLLPLFCSSVIRVYPDARFVLLTTPGTQLPTLPVRVQVVSRPIGAGPLLYERLRAYIAFLEDIADDRPCLFLESDMLMLERLRVQRQPDWDLALTYKSRGAWINSGMILVRADRRSHALAFLHEAQRLYQERYLNVPDWGSDQNALRDAVGLTEPPAVPRVQATTMANVLLIPRDTFTGFADQTWSALFRKPATSILHFSGPRKKMMRPYYWLHLGSGAVFERPLLHLMDLPLRVRRRLRRFLGSTSASTRSSA